ncbi:MULTISPECIES: S-methyl-5'-thioinosine phosphorylase [unclassified Oceanobacter]|jgi:5'-methylthioinosine phosphorylase|uniref:S-methyl-5'-thioinosine phosphorylase n=1 Tax=unclassified Oceanobacter TaxID=2620260 RepID=UPI00273592A2|nr:MULTISPECIES: S-methyl-5'-thioinosine phosphorylase [unclassified Oceanobacter]MDP2609274.1 S-methyl-5'-thioinosine phosphorylase [Oceanobacter sp. 1_MG-2023]MDP2612629.1 S-methyl-5'-thioinosine phosphorylase [Oceanobacter sp. 2_MG-2023]
MSYQRIGIIGGTGLTHLEGPEVTARHDINTVLGTPSGSVHEGLWEGREVLFMARHGHPHSVPPHKVNYRANLLALQELGAEAILAVNAVGGIHPDMGAGAIVIPDQLIDLTWGRESTFFDGSYQPLNHIDFTEPFDAGLRQALIEAARVLPAPVSDYGVVGVTQGPRLETAAEVNYLERIGCDLVGMTSMPEAVLARELGIPYASVCLVVNPAAGRSDAEITMADIQAVLDSGMNNVRDLLAAVLLSL